MSFEIIDIPPGVYPGGNRIPVLIDWYDVAGDRVFLHNLYFGNALSCLKSISA